MRIISTITVFAALVLSCQAAALPSAANATPTPASRTQGPPSGSPTWNAALKKRCNEGETCPDITAGPEVPIAVTTTMATTKIVSCTTTTTVVNSQTSTLTLWSTEVQTSTEHIQGASTVTVWLVTPAPEIKSTTWQQEETYTFTRTGTSTSFWTESKAVQTNSTTITGSTTTWTDGGKPSSSDCHECDNKGTPPASTSSAGPQPAWTQTTAPGGPSGGFNNAGNGALAPLGSSRVSSPAVGWMGNGSAGPAGASSAGSAIPAMAQGAATPVPNGSGVPLSNPANAQGNAFPPQSGANPAIPVDPANPAGQGMQGANSPFSSAGLAGPRFLGSSGLLFASTLMAVVCSAVLL